MVDYSERFNEAMKLRSVSTSMLAKELGITYQAIKKILDGKSAALSAENNAKAAKYLQINSYWLATGEESMALQESSATPPLAVLIQRLSRELQHVDAANRPLLAHAIKVWADAPEQWERLVQQLRNLGVDVGLAPAAPPAEEHDPLPAQPSRDIDYVGGKRVHHGEIERRAQPNRRHESAR